MNARMSLDLVRKFCRLAPMLAVVLTVGVAQASERIAIPEQHPGPPIYARLLHLRGDTETMAFVFYRAPACVPLDFNLLNLFDFGLLDPPEGCEILMSGFMLYEEGSFAPKQEVLHDVPGVPVPIWFVEFGELLELIDTDGDGTPDVPLTIGDLENMDSLQKGWANSYSEVLHAVGGAQVPKINVVTSGVLEDGQSFLMVYEHANTYLPTVTMLRIKD